MILMTVVVAAGLLQSVLAAIPLDGRVYDEYLKTQPGKERKAFLREAFGGGQFDMRDIFELVAASRRLADGRRGVQARVLVDGRVVQSGPPSAGGLGRDRADNVRLENVRFHLADDTTDVRPELAGIKVR